MRMIVIGLLTALMMMTGNGRTISVGDAQFELPTGWKERELQTQDVERKAVFSAIDEDAEAAMTVCLEATRRDLSALRKRCAEQAGIEVSEVVAQDGTRFLLAEEACADVTIRMAVANRGKWRYTFVFSDTDGRERAISTLKSFHIQ